MNEVPIASSAPAVHEPGRLQLSDQFPQFPRHGVRCCSSWRLSPRGYLVKGRLPHRPNSTACPEVCASGRAAEVPFHTAKRAETFAGEFRQIPQPELPDAHGVTDCSVAVGTEQALGRSRGGSIVVLVCGCRPVIV